MGINDNSCYAVGKIMVNHDNSFQNIQVGAIR